MVLWPICRAAGPYIRPTGILTPRPSCLSQRQAQRVESPMSNMHVRSAVLDEEKDTPMQVKNQQGGTEEAYAPMHIMELELGQPLPSLYAVNERTGRPYQRALCLVRLHCQPLGTIELSLAADGTRAEEYASHIWLHLGQQINEHLHHDG